MLSVLLQHSDACGILASWVLACWWIKTLRASWIYQKQLKKKPQINIYRGKNENQTPGIQWWQD